MDTLIEQGVLGIVVGIITTVLLFGLKTLWSAKITPYIVATRYQGVQIDGVWKGASEIKESEEGPVCKNECNLFLTQKAHELGGTFIYNYEDDKTKFTLNFNVSGYIWEGYVTLNFTPKDRKVTSYATSLLKLHDGGYSLVGTWLFRNVITEFVSQTPLSLGRENNS